MKYKTIDMEERFFAGIEHKEEITFGEFAPIQETWNIMFHKTLSQIKMKTDPPQMIGLNCYDFDNPLMGSYYALCETIDVIPQLPGIITKKIPQGRYICFEARYDDIHQERRKIYAYCEEQNINIHRLFDFEFFRNDQRYDVKGAICDICIKLEDD